MSNVEAIKKADVVGYLVTHKATNETRLQEKPLDDLPYNRHRFECEPLVRASTLEDLQRENAELLDENTDLKNPQWPAWAKAVLKVIRSHTGYDGYDDATEGVDMPRELEEHLSEMDAENGRIRSRAEAADAEVKRLQAEIDRKSSMPWDHRYWEGRYRDEAAENDRLRKSLKALVSDLENRSTGGTVNCSHGTDTACCLASAGEEHHADK